MLAESNMATRVNIMLDDDSWRVLGSCREVLAAAALTPASGSGRVRPGDGMPQPRWMHCARACPWSGPLGSFDGYGRGGASALGGAYVTAEERYVRLTLQTRPNRTTETTKSPPRPPNHHRLPVQLVETQKHSPVPRHVQNPRRPAETKPPLPNRPTPDSPNT